MELGKIYHKNIGPHVFRYTADGTIFVDSNKFLF